MSIPRSPVCATKTTHHNPSLSSGPAFSFSAVSLVSLAEWNVQQLAVLSAARIVGLLVKHLINGNTKAKAENPRPHQDQEVSASFSWIFCPADERPFRPCDICLQCLVRLTKHSVNANRTKWKMQELVKTKPVLKGERILHLHDYIYEMNANAALCLLDL